MQRLRPPGHELARALFLLMAEVFEEPGEPLGDTHALQFYRALGSKESPVTFFTFANQGD